MEESETIIKYYKNKLSSTKLSLLFTNILIDMCDKIDPLTELLFNFEEIKKLLDIKENNILKLFYFNKNKLHNILYDEEELINVDDLNELNKNLSFYFYLNLLFFNYLYLFENI